MAAWVQLRGASSEAMLLLLVADGRLSPDEASTARQSLGAGKRGGQGEGRVLLSPPNAQGREAE